MILKHIYEGGYFFMIPIVIIWLAVIGITVTDIVRRVSGIEKPTKFQRNNNLILFLGSFAFLLGVLAQIIGMMQALSVIEQVGDISLALIAGGLKVSFIAPVYGFVLFIVSLTVWFINRTYVLKS